MKNLFFVAVAFLCVNLTFSNKSTYKAAIVNLANRGGAGRYAQIIHEAAKSNVDILVLPSPTSAIETSVSGSDNYDEVTNTISEAAKQGALYVVAHLYERARCQGGAELVRSNLVFDRQGTIVSVYRKPVRNVANCTMSAGYPTFSTDFGVTFGSLMEEDIVLQNFNGLKNLKNFVVAGTWTSEIPFFSGAHFSSSWAYVTGGNLVSSRGIFAGRSGLETSGDNVDVVELMKEGGGQLAKVPVVNPTKDALPVKDLSQYVIRPLDTEASVQGYTESVCHGQFCCEFYVKTSFEESKSNQVSYGLAAFAGVRHVGGAHRAGAEICAIFVCAGMYKRSCTLGSENNSTSIHFDKVTITANFTKENSAQYPIVQTTSSVNNFKFVPNVKQSLQVTLEVMDSQNLLNLGIFGRVFSKDFEADIETKNFDTEGLTLDVYEYFFNDNVKEFFDYVWIRVRILLVVVSIYFLEMM